MQAKTFKRVDTALILVALIGVGLSLTAFFYVQQWEQEFATNEIKKQADAHVRALRQSFVTFTHILQSIRGLYDVHNHINSSNFTQFVKRELLTYPGIHTLEWVLYVPNEKRTEIEQQIKVDSGADFTFWQYDSNGKKQKSPNRQAYYPVLFIEAAPNVTDTHDFGHDLGSNSVIKTALEQATEQGQLVASGAIPIPIRDGEMLGFRAFVPVYKEDNVTSKHKNLVGFASSVFLFENVVQSILRIPRQRTDIFLIIEDDTLNPQATQLFAPHWYDKETAAHTTVLSSVPLEFGGRVWQIKLCGTTKTFAIESIYAFAVLLIGLLFTGSISLYIYTTLTRAFWAENLVAKRTESLSEAVQALSEEVDARVRVNIALEISRRRFRAIFDGAAMGIVQTDLQGKILESNKAIQHLLGYHEQELQYCHLNQFVYPDDIDIDHTMHVEMLNGYSNNYSVSKRYRCKNNTFIWTNQNCSIVRNQDDSFIISMIEDVTERKMAEIARLEAERKYRDIFENAIEGIFQCNFDGRYLNVNPALVRMFGYDSAERIYQEINHIGQQIHVEPKRYQAFIQQLTQQLEVQNFEYQAYCRDGHIIWVSETVRVVKDKQDNLLYYEGIIENITERKNIEKKLRYDASHDQLTGLLNRRAFTKYLTDALTRLHHTVPKHQILPEHSLSFYKKLTKTEQIPFVVLFLDLDRFKIVNDSMGHLIGDKLLIEIAYRLTQEIGKNNIVARFGGDEFALLLENVPNLLTLEQHLEKIQQTLSAPYYLEHEIFNTTTSIGVALSSHKYSNANEILRDADTAMYEAKRRGRGKAIIFQLGMHTQVVNLLRMESDLRRAFEQEEFKLYYQPIISLETQNTISVEALLRWEHPEKGLIMPDKFINITEETGLIVELGLWVFRTACEQLRRWQVQFPHHTHLGMNINVSPVQLKQPRLVYEIQDILQNSGIVGHTCHIEITESAIMQDPEAILSVLQDLKALETELYIDDFGTGYSSLSYLQKFPIDALKIDKSFIQKIEISNKSTQIAQAIIALGEAFNLKVVAEGVENQAQASILSAARCHQVQGFLFSRPKSQNEIESYLSR